MIPVVPTRENSYMVPDQVKIRSIKNNNGRKALIDDNDEGIIIGTLCYIPFTNVYCLNTGNELRELFYHDLKELRILGR